MQFCNEPKFDRCATFLLEKAVLWRHCHDDEACSVHNTAASLVIVGDAFHTFVDGAVIAQELGREHRDRRVGRQVQVGRREALTFRASALGLVR